MTDNTCDEADAEIERLKAELKRATAEAERATNEKWQLEVGIRERLSTARAEGFREGWSAARKAASKIAYDHARATLDEDEADEVAGAIDALKPPETSGPAPAEPRCPTCGGTRDERRSVPPPLNSAYFQPVECWNGAFHAAREDAWKPRSVEELCRDLDKAGVSMSGLAATIRATEDAARAMGWAPPAGIDAKGHDWRDGIEQERDALRAQLAEAQRERDRETERPTRSPKSASKPLNPPAADVVQLPRSAEVLLQEARGNLLAYLECDGAHENDFRIRGALAALDAALKERP